jgi:hypothetical protein
MKGNRRPDGSEMKYIRLSIPLRLPERVLHTAVTHGDTFAICGRVSHSLPTWAVLSSLGMEAEGWYQDPFGLHQHRWFSAGRPTALVRDGAVESHDPPPAGSFDGPLVEASRPDGPSGDDMKRADAREPQSGILDVFGMTQTPTPTDL